MEDQIGNWISLALSSIALGTVVYGWFTAGGTKAMSKVDALAKRLDAEEKIRSDAILARFQLIESRVQSIEGELKHLPDSEATHRLEMALEKMTGAMAVLEERMKPIAAINERLQEWALERGK